MPYYGRDQGNMIRRGSPALAPTNRPRLGANPPPYPAPRRRARRPDDRAGPLGANPIGQLPGPVAQGPPTTFNPTAHLAPLPGYSNPTQNQQAQLGTLMAAQTGMDPATRVAMGDPHAIMQARAAQYAQHRLAQLRAIAPQLSPELQGMLGQQQGLDPAAAWRMISAKFAPYAQQQGYADPRMMLQLAGLNQGQRGY